MKRCIWFTAEMTICCLAALVSVAGAANTPKQVNVDLRQHPTGGKTPVEVSVGLYVTNLVAIDETRESFELGGYLIGSWQDPRLALPAAQNPENAGQTATRTYRVEDLWTPAIEAANSISHKTNSYTLEADRNGTVTYVERFDAVLLTTTP